MFNFKKTIKTESIQEVSIQTPFYFQYSEYSIVRYGKLTEDNRLIVINETGDFFIVYDAEFIINEKLNRMDHEIDAEQFDYYRSKTFSYIASV